MEVDSVTSPYKHYGNEQTNYMVKLTDPKATVFDLKFHILECYQFADNSYDLYYHDLMLKDDDILSTFDMPKGFELVGVYRTHLTVKREDREVYLHVSDKITVAELKTKLRDMFNFPTEFELQHPDQPDDNLDDNSSLASVGLDATSSTLIATETGNVDAD
ncbi:hypothetical protein ACFE04_020046 [Oxalis oulophora]